MASDRLTNPALPMHVLQDIILDGGYYRLSPERRFDQSIFSLWLTFLEDATTKTIDRNRYMVEILRVNGNGYCPSRDLVHCVLYSLEQSLKR